MLRGQKKYADMTDLKQEILDMIISKGIHEATQMMYALYSLTEQLAIDDWRRINIRLAAHVLRADIGLQYRDIKKSPDISDRHFYNMLIDQALNDVGDYLKSDKNYKNFHEIMPKLLAALDKLK